jgi:hypothetical protein
VKRVISGGLFALFVVLVFEALALFGVISTLAGHIAVFAAWIVGVILITTEIIPGKGVSHKSAAVVILGVILFGLDVWGVHVKKGLDASHANEQVSKQPRPGVLVQQPEEKPPVEPTPQQPNQKSTGTAKDKVPPSVRTSGNNSPAVGSVTQGPGSIAQVGGSGNTAIIGDEPAQFVLTTISENVPADNSRFKTQFKLEVSTKRAILLHIKATAPSLVGNIEWSQDVPPGHGGMASMTKDGFVGQGYAEETVQDVSTGTYTVTAYSSRPEKVTFDYEQR